MYMAQLGRKLSLGRSNRYPQTCLQDQERDKAPEEDDHAEREARRLGALESFHRLEKSVQSWSVVRARRGH
jgi:hypothetical protein